MLALKHVLRVEELKELSLHFLSHEAATPNALCQLAPFLQRL